MSLEEALLLQFLAAFISKEEVSLPQDTDWQKLYHLAGIHTVQGILYQVLKEQKKLDQIPAEVEAALKNSYAQTLVWTVTQEYEMEQVLRALNEQQILHVLFKGWQLRDYYPVKELRTMGDVDLLVKPEDQERTGELLQSMGFRIREDGDKVKNYRKDGLEIEVHTDISAGMSFNSAQCQTYFSDALMHTIDGEQPYSRYFDVNYHFIFLLFHLAKHFSYLGAGLRMFLDIVIYMNRFSAEMDWKYIEAELAKMGLLEFHRYVLYLCRIWLGMEKYAGEVQMEQASYETVCRYVLAGGIFGYAERDESTFRLRKGVKEDASGSRQAARVRAYRGHLFPDREYMEQYLPAVKKYGILLPAAWVIRAWEGLFRRRENTMRNMKAYAGNVDKATEQQKLLRGIGL